MVWIPGSNNGEWGLNMSRGAMFPAVKGFNGPMGSPGYPLPQLIQHPAPTMDKPYMGRAFGTVYQLTPGGITTTAGWGFQNKAKSFGRKRKSKRSTRKSKRSTRSKRSKRSKRSTRKSKRKNL